MKPACVKARVARKSRGQKCPYGFDSRPEHINSPSRYLGGLFCILTSTNEQQNGTLGRYICSKVETMATKRTKTDYENAAKTSQSIAGMCRYFGLKPCGGNYKIIHKAIKEYDLDISHFTGQGWNTDLHFKPYEAKPIEDILVADSNYQSYKLKRRLIQEGFKDNICERCRLSEWQGAPIPLELHHINGNNRDNRLENLALLCPNCHALTESYRGKNKSR